MTIQRVFIEVTKDDTKTITVLREVDISWTGREAPPIEDMITEVALEARLQVQLAEGRGA